MFGWPTISCFVTNLSPLRVSPPSPRFNVESPHQLPGEATGFPVSRVKFTDKLGQLWTDGLMDKYR